MTVWVGTAALALALACATPLVAQNRRFAPQPRQQHHAGQWLRQHRNLTPEQQKKALENDPTFRNLPSQQQQHLRGQLQRFNSLPPAQQDRWLNRMETWEHLTPDQKQQARGLYRQWRQLPPDRRH